MIIIGVHFLVSSPNYRQRPKTETFRAPLIRLIVNYIDLRGKKNCEYEMIISVAKILSDTMRRLRSKDLYRSVCVIFLYAVESQQACCWRYNNFITNTTANRPERNLVSDSHDFFSRPLNQSRVSFCFFFDC